MTQLTEALQECNLVFVYGTLKAGRGNHRLLRHTEFVGEGTTISNFYMVGSGVPYLIPGGEHRVLGEVYTLPDEDTLEALDRLEGHPHHYRREVVDILVGDKRLRCWCYLMARETNYPYMHLTEYKSHPQIQVF